MMVDEERVEVGRICTKKGVFLWEGGWDTILHYLGKADGGEIGTGERKLNKEH